MASYSSGEFELKPCPYYPGHMVSHTKWAAHVAKCAKTVPRGHIMMCPYNANHRVPLNEYEKHVTMECEEIDPQVLESVVKPSLKIRKQLMDQNLELTSCVAPTPRGPMDEGDWS